jgi:hypothetical protein
MLGHGIAAKLSQRLGEGVPMNKRGRLTNDLSFVPGNVCLLRSVFLNGGRGFSNYVDNDIRLGEHRHVAARHLGDGRSHAL